MDDDDLFLPNVTAGIRELIGKNKSCSEGFGIAPVIKKSMRKRIAIFLWSH